MAKPSRKGGSGTIGHFADEAGVTDTQLRPVSTGRPWWRIRSWRLGHGLFEQPLSRGILTRDRARPEQRALASRQQAPRGRLGPADPVPMATPRETVGAGSISGTGQISVSGFGPTLSCAFEQAAAALVAVITDPAAVQTGQTVAIELQASEPGPDAFRLAQRAGPADGDASDGFSSASRCDPNGRRAGTPSWPTRSGLAD